MRKTQRAERAAPAGPSPSPQQPAGAREDLAATVAAFKRLDPAARARILRAVTKAQLRIVRSEAEAG